MDFTDGYGSRFAQRLRQDRLALNLDRNRDLSPHHSITPPFHFSPFPIPNS